MKRIALIGTIALVAGLLSLAAPATAVPEMLDLDTYEAADDGAAGPVVTAGALTAGAWYLVTVDGTYSAWPSSTWPGSNCGFSEASPEYASVGTLDTGLVGIDAEWWFADPNDPGCVTPGRSGTHRTTFEMDLGSGWSHMEAIGGVPSGPSSDHSYRYLVQGEGSAANFRLVDLPTSDNYGSLKITVDALTLSLSPDEVFNPVDSVHTVTATANDAGIPIHFDVTGANPGSGNDLTGDDKDDDGDTATEDDGDATFDYMGTVSGVDTIVACVDADEEGDCDAGELSVDVTKYWFTDSVHVSGTIGQGQQTYNTYGKVKGAPAFTFSGTIYNVAGTAYGGVWVNYKSQTAGNASDDQCFFDATGVPFEVGDSNSDFGMGDGDADTDDDSVRLLHAVEMSCSSGAASTDASILLIDRTTVSTEPRGSIRIDASEGGMDTYDVGTGGNSWPLDTGNVILNLI